MKYCWLTTRFKQVMHTLQLRDDMTLTASADALEPSCAFKVDTSQPVMTSTLVRKSSAALLSGAMSDSSYNAMACCCACWMTKLCRCATTC
eukprot:jgi/Chrzof1/2810/UNPLg00725.t1